MQTDGRPIDLEVESCANGDAIDLELVVDANAVVDLELCHTRGDDGADVTARDEKKADGSENEPDAADGGENEADADARPSGIEEEGRARDSDALFSAGHVSSMEGDGQDAGITVSFCVRIVNCDHAHEPFDRCDTASNGDGKRWEEATYDELLEFVKTQMLVSFDVVRWTTSFYLSTGTSGADLQITGQRAWLRALRTWGVEDGVVFINFAAAERFNMPSLEDLQQDSSTSRQRTHEKSRRAAKQLNDLVDKVGAERAVPQSVTPGDLVLFSRIREDVAYVFGTADCLPHPGTFICPCCGEPRRLARLCELTNAVSHLKSCSRKADAMQFARRYFELSYEGDCRTPIPSTRQIAVPPNHVFHFAPNRLADGTVLQWDLYLLNHLIQSGKIRRTHLLLQMIGAFVTPFFGLGGSTGVAWHRFLTLWLFAETVRNMSNKVFLLMRQNGQIGSQSASSEEGAQSTRGRTPARSRRRRGHALSRGSRTKSLFLDPHQVNLILPDASSMEKMLPPLNPDDGPDQDALVAFLMLLVEVHTEHPDKGVMIETDEDGEVTVLLAPTAIKFDGTTVAGGLFQIGSRGQARIIGSTEKITLKTVLEWMSGTESNHRAEHGEPEEDGPEEEQEVEFECWEPPEDEAEDEADGEISESSSSGSESDKDESDTDEIDGLSIRRLDKHMNRLAPKLIRGMDAYEIQSVTVPIHMHYANYGKTLASAVKEVTVGQKVEARYRQDDAWSYRYNKATVTTKHTDGAADLRFERGDIPDQPRVPRERIRTPQEQNHLKVAEEVATVFAAAQSCLSCITAGRKPSECSFSCSECTEAGCCDACKDLGYRTHVSERRRCTHCQRAGCRCVRARPFIVESDKEAVQVKGLKAMTERGSQYESRLKGPVWIVHGIQHALKGARAPLINWYLAVFGDIVGITDLLALFTQPYGPLVDIITKEVLQYKDRHNFTHVAHLFGKLVTDCLDGIVCKSTIFPELYKLWLALFQKKDQKVLVKPRFIAFHEEGGIALADANNTVVVGRLSNPVEFTSPASFGQPGKKPTPRDLADGGKTPHRRPAHQARFESPAGLDFLAREVVILADTQRNELRVLHTGKDKCAYLMYAPKLQLPLGVATLSRLDASAGAELQTSARTPVLTAEVVVTESESGSIILLNIEQKANAVPMYKATATRIFIGGAARASSPQPLPLSGICAMPVGKVAIGVLRTRRNETIAAADAALQEASDDEPGAHAACQAARAAAHSAFQRASQTPRTIFVARAGYADPETGNAMDRSGHDTAGAAASGAVGATGEQTANLPPSIVRIDLSLMDGDPNKRSSDGTVVRTCPGTVICTVNRDPFDVTVDQEGSVYVSSLDSACLWRVQKEGGSWVGAVYAGQDQDAGHTEPKDGESSSCTFGGVAGIAAYQCGRTVFAIDKSTNSVCKIAHLEGFSIWGRAWQSSSQAMGERDPTTDGRFEGNWASAIPKLEESASVLAGIMQSRLDAIGYKHGQGPQLMMDPNSVRAHTETTVPSMRAAHAYIVSLSPSVASKLDQRSVTEKECEYWWAKIRMLALDAAFDLLMYYTIVPKVRVEMLKRMLGCFFVYNTTDRKVDTASYNFQATLGTGANGSLLGRNKYLRLMGGPGHNAPRVMETTTVDAPPARPGAIATGRRKKLKKRTGRIIRNSDGIWSGIGSTLRLERRCDIRRLAADMPIPCEKRYRAGRNGMRRLFRMGKRLRELMVRSRMKQAVSMPYNTQNREHLTVENDEDASRGEDFRLSCNLPLLRAGDILLERVVTQATHDSDDDTGTDDDDAPTSQSWGLMRVVEDKARPSTISTACEVLAVDGVWDERSQGYAFVDRQRTDRKLVEFGCFYATKSSIHVSGLFVVNASDIFHGEVCGEDGATTDCNIARFSENQVRFFDRVARLDAERPEWQYEWWKPIKSEAEAPRKGPGFANVRTRESEGAEQTNARDQRRTARAAAPPR